MVSVQCEFGQSGAPGMGLTGAAVFTLNARFPFLMSLPGRPSTPVSVTSAGFWPGGCVAPAGLVHCDVGVPVAVTAMTTSPFPKPAIDPDAVRVTPLSVNDGEPCLK